MDSEIFSETDVLRGRPTGSSKYVRAIREARELMKKGKDVCLIWRGSSRANVALALNRTMIRLGIYDLTAIVRTNRKTGKVGVYLVDVSHLKKNGGSV